MTTTLIISIVIYFFINIFTAGGYFFTQLTEDKLVTKDLLFIPIIILFGVFFWVISLFQAYIEQPIKESKKPIIKFYLEIRNESKDRVIAYWETKNKKHCHILADKRDPHYCIPYLEFTNLLNDSALVQLTNHHVITTKENHLHKEILKYI